MVYIMAKNKNIISVALHPEIISIIDKIPKKSGITRNKIINWALAFWLGKITGKNIPLYMNCNKTIHKLLKDYE
jgi:hypothetical protein